MPRLIAARRCAAMRRRPSEVAAMISDPIEFELFKNALLDGEGVLVAQGLTLPGHLGSMPTAMAAVRAAFAGRVYPGDVFILNDPFQGGMHLHDVFIFKPIFQLQSADGEGVERQ